MTSEGDKQNAWSTIKNDPKYLSEKYTPADIEKLHIRYYCIMNKKEKNNPLKDSNPWTDSENKDLTITKYDAIQQNDQDEEKVSLT